MHPELLSLCKISGVKSLAEADEIIADPNHPIWKIMLALVAVLAAAWGVAQ